MIPAQIAIIKCGKREVIITYLVANQTGLRLTQVIENTQNPPYKLRNILLLLFNKNRH
jgi:hypothetical protein